MTPVSPLALHPVEMRIRATTARAEGLRRVGRRREFEVVLQSAYELWCWLDAQRRKS